MNGNEYIYLGSKYDYVLYTGKDFENYDSVTDTHRTLRNNELLQVVFLNPDMTKVYCRNSKNQVFQFGTKFMLQNFEVYDAKEKGLPDNWTVNEPTVIPQLKDDEVIVTKQYLETFFMITADMAQKVTDNLHYGRAEMQDLFDTWTKKFEKLNSDTDWEDGENDFYDAIEKFEDTEYANLLYEDFEWDKQAAIDLQYIQNSNACPESEFFSNEQSDRNFVLAMEFRQYERNNHIDYDNPEQADFETTITKWLSEHK